MRTLKKIIKKLYHLIWFLGAFLIFTPCVSASGTGVVKIDGASYQVAPFADFADNTNGHLTRTNATFIANGSYFRSNDSILTNGANTYGANLIFDSNTTFVVGYTYLVTVLIGMSNTYPKPSSTRVCIAETLTNVVTRYNTPSQYPCSNASVVAMNGTAAFNDGNITYPYGVINYIFTADFTGTSITMSYNTVASNQSNHTFGGYSITLLSDNRSVTQSDIQSAIQNSGLASASSVNQVQQSINAMYQDLGQHAQNIIDANRYDSQQIQGAIEDTNDTIKDETAPNLDLSDLQVSSNTPISDLITMPLTILNTLVQTLDGSCSNYTIPFFYNNTITFPCFTISDYLGSTVTNYIDLFICFYMCYNIGMLVISVFEDITSLRDIYDSMYVPKHAESGYQPKHAKGGGD